mmetsp:Transcript_108025/g.337899  ORF Transcript_108025/g.337899 Transcript_108025/m.337899 type:complete len:662 (+) Transcript_108025:494-2479(+)
MGALRESLLRGILLLPQLLPELGDATRGLLAQRGCGTSQLLKPCHKVAALAFAHLHECLLLAEGGAHGLRLLLQRRLNLHQVIGDFLDLSVVLLPQLLQLIGELPALLAQRVQEPPALVCDVCHGLALGVQVRLQGCDTLRCVEPFLQHQAELLGGVVRNLLEVSVGLAEALLHGGLGLVELPLLARNLRMKEGHLQVGRVALLVQLLVRGVELLRELLDGGHAVVQALRALLEHALGSLLLGRQLLLEVRELRGSLLACHDQLRLHLLKGASELLGPVVARFEAVRALSLRRLLGLLQQSEPLLEVSDALGEVRPLLGPRGDGALRLGQELLDDGPVCLQAHLGLGLEGGNRRLLALQLRAELRRVGARGLLLGQQLRFGLLQALAQLLDCGRAGLQALGTLGRGALGRRPLLLQLRPQLRGLIRGLLTRRGGLGLHELEGCLERRDPCGTSFEALHVVGICAFPLLLLNRQLVLEACNTLTELLALLGLLIGKHLQVLRELLDLLLPLLQVLVPLRLHLAQLDLLALQLGLELQSPGVRGLVLLRGLQPAGELLDLGSADLHLLLACNGAGLRQLLRACKGGLEGCHSIRCLLERLLLLTLLVGKRQPELSSLAHTGLQGSRRVGLDHFELLLLLLDLRRELRHAAGCRQALCIGRPGI